MKDGALRTKYRVERMDGEVRPGSRFFVLDYGRDLNARAALRAYAEQVAESHPILSRSILDELAAIEAHERGGDSGDDGDDGEVLVPEGTEPEDLGPDPIGDLRSPQFFERHPQPRPPRSG